MTNDSFVTSSRWIHCGTTDVQTNNSIDNDNDNNNNNNNDDDDDDDDDDDNRMHNDFVLLLSRNMDDTRTQPWPRSAASKPCSLVFVYVHTFMIRSRTRTKCERNHIRIQQRLVDYRISQTGRNEQAAGAVISFLPRISQPRLVLRVVDKANQTR